MNKNIRTLEVFNTLEAFKRREYKLVKESIGLLGITAGTVIASTTFLPEAIAVIPCIAVAAPATILAIKKAKEADAFSSHADTIFKANSDRIINFKLNNMDEKQFTEQFPVLSKSFLKK